MLRLSLTTLLLACAAPGALLALPAAAPAAPYMVSVMQDDNQLAYGTARQRRVALDRMKNLGVEAVRVTMLWNAVAPANNARRKPRRFDGSKPGDYPAHLWDRYDDLVLAAQQRGITTYFNPTGPGPRWGHRTAPVEGLQRSFRPSPKEFRKFVRAAGRRYSGSYRDENSGRRVLPRVSWWALWNEPNQGGWLSPQGERRPGVGSVSASPHLYRELMVAGAKGLLASGHGEDLVLIGELAPLGAERPDGPREALRPGLFLRELFCLDRRYRPFAGRESTVRGCDHAVSELAVLERFPRLGFAHHPYTKKLSPQRRDTGRDAMTMANIDALPRALDRIAAVTGLLPPDMPVFLTEYGYETSPPDPFAGISPALQAQYINEGDFIAWRHPRIFSNTQFQLFDVPPQREFPRDTRPYWRTYQSGLFTHEPFLRAKPAANAYKFPLVVRRRGSTARIWGQARFAPNGATYAIVLQERAPGSSTWVRSGDPVPVTHHQGYFQARRPTRRGSAWRAVWVEPDLSRAEVSREAAAR
jgi:hypothetical protein